MCEELKGDVPKAPLSHRPLTFLKFISQFRRSRREKLRGDNKLFCLIPQSTGLWMLSGTVVRFVSSMRFVKYLRPLWGASHGRTLGWSHSVGWLWDYLLVHWGLSVMAAQNSCGIWRKMKKILTNPQRLDAFNECSLYLQLISSNVITLMIINIVENKSHSGDWESVGQVFRRRRVQ